MTRPFSKPDIFKALADPTRRSILAKLLAEGELPVNELIKNLNVSQSACSQHLRVLRDIDVVRQRQEATSRIYHLNPEPLREVFDYASQFEKVWSSKFKKLEKAMKAK